MADTTQLRRWAAGAVGIYFRAVVVVTVGLMAYATFSARSYWNVANVHYVFVIAAALTAVTVLVYAVARAYNPAVARGALAVEERLGADGDEEDAEA
jgi:hypothetical protein